MSTKVMPRKQFMSIYNEIKLEHGYDDKAMHGMIQKWFGNYSISLKAFLKMIKPNGRINLIIEVACRKAFPEAFSKYPLGRGAKIEFDRKNAFLGLYAERLRMGNTYTKMQQELEAHYCIADGTLRDTVSREKTNLNGAAVIAFCFLYHIDIKKIYWDELPNRAEAVHPVITQGQDDVNSDLTNEFMKAFAGERFLDDEGYFHTFHGIMYPRNSTLNKVENLRFFTLTLTRGEGSAPPSATLSYINKGDENRKSESRLFHGIPVLSPRNDVVFILFQDDNPRAGTFFHFYFSYHMVNATNLTFNRGFVVTSLSDRQRSEIPVVLNFIMGNRPPIDSATVQMYPELETLLQHANMSVCVPADEFHATLSKYPDVSYLFDQEAPLSAVDREDLCVINEPRLLEAIKSLVPSRELRQEAYRCLLELKKASLSITHATWETMYDDLFREITEIQ